MAVNYSYSARMCNTADLLSDPQVTVMPLGFAEVSFLPTVQHE